MSMTPLRVAMPKSVMKPMMEATDRTPPGRNTPIPRPSAPAAGYLIDIGKPSQAVPFALPGIRVPYHGGSNSLSTARNTEPGRTDGVEIAIAQRTRDYRGGGGGAVPGGGGGGDGAAGAASVKRPHTGTR